MASNGLYKSSSTDYCDMVVQWNINILNMGYHRLALETLKYIKTEQNYFAN